MYHDNRIEKPKTKQGISDPVNVFLDDGRIYVAYWSEKDHYWHDTDGETFGNVEWWSEIVLPKTWACDWSRYGDEV
jgi:hypothetical protein